MKIVEKYNILSLLPYSEESQLINKNQKLADLYFIKSVVDISLMALENFIEGKLVLFDAQVGENLCQIRAFKIIELANKYLNSLEEKQEIIIEISHIKNYKNKLEEVIIQWENAVSHAFSYNKSLDAHETIGDFIERNDIGLDLKEDGLFIIACFFLAHFSFRDEGLPVAINLNFVSRELHVSKYKAKRLIHKHQVLVCEFGCKAIIAASKKMICNFGYFDILPQLCKISDESRAVLPCYLTSEVIFNYSIKERTPIALIVHRINPSTEKVEDVIYFILVGNSKNELELVPIEKYCNHNCIVVFCEVHLSQMKVTNSINSYIDLVLTESPMKLILANTASHPQYSGIQLEHLKDNPLLEIPVDFIDSVNIHKDRLANMKLFALNEGCSKENPTKLFLKHVYASKISHEINRLEKTYLSCLYDAHKLAGS